MIQLKLRNNLCRFGSRSTSSCKTTKQQKTMLFSTKRHPQTFFSCYSSSWSYSLPDNGQTKAEIYAKNSKRKNLTSTQSVISDGHYFWCTKTLTCKTTVPKQTPCNLIYRNKNTHHSANFISPQVQFSQSSHSTDITNMNNFITSQV